MKTILANLNGSIQSSYANNGKTTTFGRAFQKAINSQNVLGPPLTQWVDILQLYALNPLDCYYNPNTGHLFVLSAVSTTLTALNIWVQLFNFSAATNWVPSYVGKVNMNFGNAAASAPTIKGFSVYESGGNITPIISVTGAVAIEGGTYIAYNLTTASFTIGGSTAWAASGASQAGYMYFLQDPAALGVNHVATTAWGQALPQFSASGSVNTKVWQANGTLALPQMYSWDLSVAPTVAGSVTNGVNSLSGGYTVASTGVSVVCAFNMSSLNGYALGTGADQVVLQAGTGSVPTTYTAWLANTLQTTSNVYFTRDVQYVYTFTNLATPSGITAGATYTVGGVTLTCSIAYLSGVTTLLMNTTSGTAIPASGTLILATGTGPASIAYSAQTSQVYFNLAATSGGAAVASTQTQSSFTMMRAFGTSSSMFNLKTGVLTAITGGTIVNNTMNYCKPISSPANTTLQGLDCLSFQTSTSLYMFKISDLTSGATTWPSLLTAGILNTGTGIDVTAITTTQGEYSGAGLTGDLDNFVYVTNGSTYVVKPYKVPGSALTSVFGGTTDTYYAGQNPVTIQAGLAAVTQIHTNGGFLFVCSTTVGQAGLVIVDMGSDANFGYSGIVGPVSAIPSGTVYKYIDTIEQLFNYTDSMNFWVRSASTSTDPSFSSVTLPTGSPSSSGVVSNGWTSLATATDNSSVAVGPYFQFCVTYDILTLDANTPAQIFDIISAILPPAEQSDYWAVDNDNTTQGLGSPSYVSWRLMTAYQTSVPTLYARVYDTSGNLIFSANTSSNPSAFQYSTNDGTSWTALGTIPNTVDTRVRVLVSPTPSVTVAQPSIRES